MNIAKVKDSDLRNAASAGMDEFLKVFTDAIMASVDGELTADTMAELNSDQITLLAYDILHNEVMDGGFVQLIYNGYGSFLFRNPFAKAIKGWGIDELASLVKKAGKLYFKYKNEIERECTDDEFMAMFEQYPEFDDLDDLFVENEETWTGMVACYVDEHIERFVTVEE
ncbi:DMP19 family protein [Xylanibacter rarus]|uniref:DMP19 family protein n=1 Tax=Xylanibacter rarus TaxID=1676614 RepID=UPI003521430A